MKLEELKFDYPLDLIATSPQRPSRVMWAEENKDPKEISIADLILSIPAGDVLVINNTKVLKRRVFTKDDVEVLFLDMVEQNETSNQWKVLFPSKKFSLGHVHTLPQGFKMKLIEKGRPQLVEVSPPISDLDFANFAEMPLPPYIQKAREERHNLSSDEKWYQTAWASEPGSMAAPTASLHFSEADIQQLKVNGVRVLELTLHVGLGTFLPVVTEDLNQHQMHSEQYRISDENWEAVLRAKLSKQKVWALGTTTTRVLETIARTNRKSGFTNLLLQPGSDFNIVDRLLTNFHQPESTLLALVASFSSLENVKQNYKWAMERKFRLFSYGDLSVWIK